MKRLKLLNLPFELFALLIVFVLSNFVLVCGFFPLHCLSLNFSSSNGKDVQEETT
jgi:hypothetical protein